MSGFYNLIIFYTAIVFSFQHYQWVVTKVVTPLFSDTPGAIQELFAFVGILVAFTLVAHFFKRRAFAKHVAMVDNDGGGSCLIGLLSTVATLWLLAVLGLKLYFFLNPEQLNYTLNELFFKSGIDYGPVVLSWNEQIFDGLIRIWLLSGKSALFNVLTIG